MACALCLFSGEPRRIADARGSNKEVLVREAIERLVDYDEWFIGEVEKGLAASEKGTLLTHEEVGVRLHELLAKKHQRS